MTRSRSALVGRRWGIGPFWEFSGSPVETRRVHRYIALRSVPDLPGARTVLSTRGALHIRWHPDGV